MVNGESWERKQARVRFSKSRFTIHHSQLPVRVCYNSRVTPPPRSFRLCLPWALLLFAACLWLDTRHNDFPFFYHRDEPDKVSQVIRGEWNFHHPALMLATV